AAQVIAMRSRTMAPAMTRRIARRVCFSRLHDRRFAPSASRLASPGAGLFVSFDIVPSRKEVRLEAIVHGFENIPAYHDGTTTRRGRLHRGRAGPATRPEATQAVQRTCPGSRTADLSGS